MTDPVRVNSLRAYIERIENIEAQKRGLSDEIAEQYANAKTSGLNPKAMRKLVAERRRKTDAEVEADLEMYRAALAEHGSLRKAAEALGVSKSKLHRTVPREKNGTAKVDVITPPEVAALPTVPPHDAETGELVGADHDAEVGDVLAAIEAEVGDDGEPETGIPVSADVPRETAMPAEVTMTGVNLAGVGVTYTAAAPPAPERTFDEAVGPIPDFLRRQRATA